MSQAGSFSTGGSGTTVTSISATAPLTANGVSATPESGVVTLALTTPVALTYGGTNASLTASNGGILYSTATAGAILAGTSTAQQLLLSGSSTAPTWSTSTYPTTNAVNTLLYASSTNTMAALATANDGVLITSNSGVPSWLANSSTPGYVLTANAGAPPSWQTAAGGGVSAIHGDSGSATGSTVTFNGGLSNAGSTVLFSASGASVALQVTDANTNTFMGFSTGNPALSTANANTAFGDESMQAVTTGSSNTALGQTALQSILNGTANTALGQGALQAITSPIRNTSVGSGSLGQLLTGGNNIALGWRAGHDYTSTEASNIIIGNNIGTIGDSTTIRLGDPSVQTSCFVAGINGVTVTGTAVLCATNGQLGTVVSSSKYKENIEKIDDKSILNLNPVKFNYISDETKTTCYGLIAEEVEKVFPDLVFYKDGVPESVKYHEMPALLLNEIQKLRRELEILKAKCGC